MRILFAHNNGDLYGSSRSLLRLAGRLARDGHCVAVVLPCVGALYQELARARIAVHLMPRLAIVERDAFKSLGGLLSFLIRLPISVLRFARLIRDFKPDWVHSNTSVMLPSALAARLAGTPHLWHLREFYTEFPAFWGVYQRIMAACSQNIICVSGAVQAQFDESVRRNTVVLHNGFPLTEFSPVQEERVQAFKARHGLSGGPLVGVVGRLKLKRKGQETFIEAASLIAHQHPGAKFVLVGGVFPGNEEHEVALHALAKKRGLADRIVFTGDVDDIKAAYAALDIVVMPSGQPEPFGGVVIEAMALGKPVIATDVGGTPEQIAHERTGLLVPPNDPERMGNAMERLLARADLRQAMGTAARIRYEELFEFEPFFKQMMNLYALQARPCR